MGRAVRPVVSTAVPAFSSAGPAVSSATVPTVSSATEQSPSAFPGVGNVSLGVPAPLSARRGVVDVLSMVR